MPFPFGRSEKEVRDTGLIPDVKAAMGHGEPTTPTEVFETVQESRGGDELANAFGVIDALSDLVTGGQVEVDFWGRTISRK